MTERLVLGRSALDQVPSGIVDGGADADVARSWLTCVHTWLRGHVTSGQVSGALEAPGPGWNFYSVVVTGGGAGRRRLLLNVAGRVVAAARHEDELTHGPWSFVDVPSPRPFVESGFLVATAEELTRPLTPERLSSLSTQQLADVAYHQPGRVGDLVFNWFD